MVELTVFPKCSLLSLEFERLLHFVPRPGPGCAHHDLPAACQMSKDFSLVQPTEALGLCGTLRMASFIWDSFSCTGSHQRYHTAALHTWCDHPLSPPCVSGAKVGVLKSPEEHMVCSRCVQSSDTWHEWKAWQSEAFPWKVSFPHLFVTH